MVILSERWLDKQTTIEFNSKHLESLIKNTIAFLLTLKDAVKYWNPKEIWCSVVSLFPKPNNYTSHLYEGIPYKLRQL
jgi:hypothetical protein